jgi:hypothetical protein
VIENGLIIKWSWHDSDVASIFVRASNGDFAGVAEPYISLDGLADAADRLAGFPTNTADFREVVFGASGEATAGGFASLKFSCFDGAGHGRVELIFESKNETRVAKSRYDWVETASFSAQIEGAAVDEFVAGLRRLHFDKAGEARLAFLVAG